MKARSLLAVLAAAAMLCTTALPAYAEDALPATSIEETAPADDTLTPADDNAQETQNEPATLEAPQTEDEAGNPVVQTQQVYIGGSTYDIPEGKDCYYIVENGTLQPGDENNWNVYAVANDLSVHITLKDAEFPDNSSDNYALVAVGSVASPTDSAATDLYVTLRGANKGYGTLYSNRDLIIDGDGSLETTMTHDTGYYAGFRGKHDVTIGDNVTLKFNNAYAGEGVSGISTESVVRIEGNANVTLTGNLRAGIYAPDNSVEMCGGTVHISGLRSSLSADGKAIIEQDGIVTPILTQRDGNLYLDNILGNGVNVTKVHVYGGLLQITNVKRFTPDGWENGYGGKAVTAAEDINIGNEGNVVCNANEVNDLFANQNVNIGGGTVKLTNGGTAVSAIGAFSMSGGDVTIEDTKYDAVSVLNTFQIMGGKLTINHSGSDAIRCADGGISIVDYVSSPEISITNCQGSGISLSQGSEDAHTHDIVIYNAKVEVASKYNAFNAFRGSVIISKDSVIKASSTDSDTIGSPDVRIQDVCDVTLTSPVRAVGNAIRINTDGLTKRGGADADSARLVEPEEMPDCQYLHIFKGQDLPRIGDTVNTKNWTEGDTPNLPTVTDKDGNTLKAKVYYKVKDAADYTYTETVPTAAGDYETALVVPADGTYAETVYYGAFTIVAKSTQPSTPSNGGNSGNTGSSTTTTTTVTATAPTPTPAPRAEAKAQNAPAAVTAAIPQTLDTFPYAILATLMGTAALGMAGITLLRKKRQ